MKLHRYQDADETLSKGPNFDVDDCTKFLGPIGNANVLVIRAQVDMAAGRYLSILIFVSVCIYISLYVVVVD